MTGAAEKYDKETVCYQGKDGLCLIHKISPDKGIRCLDLGWLFVYIVCWLNK